MTAAPARESSAAGEDDLVSNDAGKEREER